MKNIGKVTATFENGDILEFEGNMSTPEIENGSKLEGCCTATFTISIEDPILRFVKKTDDNARMLFSSQCISLDIVDGHDFRMWKYLKDKHGLDTNYIDRQVIIKHAMVGSSFQ